MLNYIKNLFSRQIDSDPNLTALRKNFNGSYKKFTDDEQAILMLRLTGMSHDKVAIALDMSVQQVCLHESAILRKIEK